MSTQISYGIDERDLTEEGPVEEAKMCPVLTHDKKLPLIFMTSTRKFAGGPVQNEIDTAAEKGTKLVIRHWNLIDVTEACPPERHLPDEPKIPIYYSNDSLKAISEEDYNKINVQEQQKFTKDEGYAGCLKNCKLFAACRGSLATKQLSKSPLLKSIDHVETMFNKISLETAKAQLLCWAPSSEGMVYPSFSKERHMLSPAQMANKITDDVYPEHFSKVQLVTLMKSLRSRFLLWDGLWIYT